MMYPPEQLQKIEIRTADFTSSSPNSGHSPILSLLNSNSDGWEITRTPILPQSVTPPTLFSVINTPSCSSESTDTNNLTVNSDCSTNLNITPTKPNIESYNYVQSADIDNTYDCCTCNDSVSDHEFTLSKFGYKIVNTMCSTLNVSVYEAKRVEPKQQTGVAKQRNSLHLGNTDSLSSEYVVIKKVEKEKALLNEAENISKEATVLHYLSVLNKCPGDTICKFIDFIETETDLYLVEEHCGEQTLGDFIQTAHQYIEQNKLKLRQWKITAKFIFWQIAVVMYWLHNDMNTCHLDLKANNIFIKNGRFLQQNDGTIVVESKMLTVKLSGIGFAEIFDKKTSFECHKTVITNDFQYQSPQQFNGQRFDARKADCYSMGVILYEILTGKKPYNVQSDEDDGYAALQRNELAKYLADHGLTASFRKETLSLIEGLMSIDEEERIDTKQIVAHQWFMHYCSRYKLHIGRKIKSQRVRHHSQTKKIQVLPYYTLNNKVKNCVL